MIIQHVLKGVGGLSHVDAAEFLAKGIICNWWRKVGMLPAGEIPSRLTERNLDWHQNRYTAPDPLEGNEPFFKHSPFISVTAGTRERDSRTATNVVHSAFQTALQFATGSGSHDGWIFDCYVFVLGRPAMPHVAFSEELRDLNIYGGFSIFQPEGEITAKIHIPPAQIRSSDWFEGTRVVADLAAGRLPQPSATLTNPLYSPPADISNVRELIL